MQNVTDRPARSIRTAMRRGAACTCPNCGKGSIFGRYLKVADTCSNCGEALHHHRADDAPPYFTIFIVGHLIVPLTLWTERVWQPDMWVHAIVWIPLAIVMTLVLLPPVKGAVVGLQWALCMHGFEYAALEGDRAEPRLAEDGRTVPAPQQARC